MADRSTFVCTMSCRAYLVNYIYSLTMANTDGNGRWYGTENRTRNCYIDIAAEVTEQEWKYTVLVWILCQCVGRALSLSLLMYKSFSAVVIPSISRSAALHPLKVRRWRFRLIVPFSYCFGPLRRWRTARVAMKEKKQRGVKFRDGKLGAVMKL